MRGIGSIKLAVLLGMTSTSLACSSDSLSVQGSTSGDVEVIETEQYTPTDVVADDQYVYWLDQGIPLGGTFTGGHLMRAKPDGSEPIALAADLRWPMHLVADESSLYWLEAGPGAVMQISKSGGSTNTLAPHQNFGAVPELENTVLTFPLAVDGTHAYWFSTDHDGKSSLVSASKVDGSGLTFLGPVDKPTALVTDSSGIYVVDGGLLERFDPQGGSPTLVASLNALAGARNLQTDARNIYWYWDDGGTQSAVVMQIRKDGWGAKALVTKVASLYGFSLRDQTLYFSTLVDDFSAEALTVSLMKVPIAGGTPDQVAAFQVQSGTYQTYAPLSMAVQGQNVFMTSYAKQTAGLRGQGDLLRLGM